MAGQSGVRYLLDTHVVLWLASDSEKVPAEVRAELSGAAERLISSATAMEIALKARLGKLPGGHAVVSGWERILRSFLATELPLSAAQMAYAGGMDWAHRDPFDRMLVSQAVLEGLVLVTHDRRIQANPAVQTLSW